MIKVKCKKAIEPTDKKAKPFFVKDGIYEAFRVGGDLFVTGEAVRKNGSKEWQAISAWPTGWVIVGVASFDEVEENAE